MIVTKWKSSKEVVIPINKYRIKWNKAPSKGQQKLQDFLVHFWEYDIVLAEMRIPGSKKRCDIVNCNKKVIIEYSPLSHHNNFNPFFHGNRSNFLKSIKSDYDKMMWAESNGFLFVEVTEADLDNLNKEYFSKTFNLNL